MEARRACGNERAKTMKTITMSAQDFEALHETSMEWTQEIWGEQIHDGRFHSSTSTWDFNHKYIYWYENYVSLMAARNILKKLDEQYAVLRDEATGQWCLTSTYQSIEWSR
jgi:hypothetical protein